MLSCPHTWSPPGLLQECERCRAIAVRDARGGLLAFYVADAQGSDPDRSRVDHYRSEIAARRRIAAEGT